MKTLLNSYNLSSREICHRLTIRTFIRSEVFSNGITDCGGMSSFTSKDNTVPSGRKRLGSYVNRMHYIYLIV